MLRFNLPDGGKEFLPATWCRHTTTGACEWRFKAWPAPRPLYGLDRLAQRPVAPVVVVEGEKTADAAAKLLPDHVVVTSPNGAKGASKPDWSALHGREVIIRPDNDDDGRTYAMAIAKALSASPNPSGLSRRRRARRRNGTPPTRSPKVEIRPEPRR